MKGVLRHKVLLHSQQAMNTIYQEIFKLSCLIQTMRILSPYNMIVNDKKVYMIHNFCLWLTIMSLIRLRLP